MKRFLMALTAMSGLALPILGQDTPEAPLPLVPRPSKVQRDVGVFELNSETRIIVADAEDRDSRNVGEQLAVQLKQSAGLNLTTESKGGERAIVLTRKNANPALGAEGYTLTVEPDGVTISATAGTGLFYGMQTFLQLLPVATPVKPLLVPAVRIEDQPRFAWRGLMLDCSRTFQSLDYLHKTIDRMAAYKMNVLHLHLTDEQGWRMEIRKNPELTRIGARFAPEYNEPPRHEGFYSQEELRELVCYAAARNVTIVPEIEMPSHCVAAVICRPELACPGRMLDRIMPYGRMLAAMDKDQGNYPIYCAGNDNTFQFLEDVLDEVMEVFPSTFIHVGGDEANKMRWRNCPKCQARIKSEGLTGEEELQSYFIRRVERHLNAKGRRLIGWSEILQGGLAPNAAVMDWIGGADAATKTGHDAVMSPTSHCYFDYPYSSISSAKAYHFEPCAGLAAEQAKRILGLQANFWSHIDREPELVDQQLFPRLLALAERAWSPVDVRDWPAFKRRLDGQLPRLLAMGVHCYHEPFAHWTSQQVTETYKPSVWDAAREQEGTYPPLVWDVTGELSGPGQYRVTFQYTGGACRLGIESVELLADGAVVSTDRHRGMTGASNQGNTYQVEVKQCSPGAKYELRAAVRSEGGTDSRGDLTIERKP